MLISNDVLEVLSTCRVDGPVVFLPPGQIDRKLYESVDKVLRAMGGAWNRKARGHVFSVDPAVRLDDAILTGEVDRPADFGFFETPSKVVARMLVLAEIESGHRLLEPSAGRGAIAVELAAYAGADVVCVELLEDSVRVLRSRLADASCLDDRVRVVCGDFLAWISHGPFDRVVMNPPFARQADIDHVRHAFGMLRPGGRLVSVMSAGVTFRQDRKAAEFRALVDSCGGSIEPLPPGSFKPSGTNVNTVLVVLEKA